ncbi:IgA peptidase M64-domain-containing protein [Plectosphaerella cucumerina]|uniref:IgA peptidase M64-domain-containing protein n=1 Tax=Plectosphaerella cucumerina TaxID=40658 RepID=A0A8K0TSK2_9PEZI|nr:IgA peptidase M64-domain-containing protein [Plectosphaerella cucumerina]
MLNLKTLLAFTWGLTSVVGQFCEHQWEGDFADHDVDGVPYLRVMEAAAAPELEIRPLIVNGPSSNRVDLIFFGDGYTESEKDKFFADALSLATNLTDGQTFADVLPLMNFWAGFTPSTESGIGVGGKAKDTVYGLYRDGTELRGVYYAKPEVARAACQSTDACDYPILLGNDPFYGGLGGTFTVVTASPHNGAAVLRHELGHSIIGVGEEYDGGAVYRGVNSARTPAAAPWKQWYTDPASEPKIQRSNMPIQAYPWTMLNVSKSWSQDFQSAGTYDNQLLQFSISGVTESSDIIVDIDGKDLGWEVNKLVGIDRWIYTMKFDTALAPGRHTLRFTLRNETIQGRAQLCNLQILEYGAADEFNFTPAYHSLYPTYSASNVTTYRPTNDLCLMRTMHSVNFCDACIEGLWQSLLRPLSLIDNITQTSLPEGHKNVTLELLPLAEFRQISRETEESYSIEWYSGSGETVIEDWANKTSVVVNKCATQLQVEVKFHSEQIRVDTGGVTVERQTIDIE